MSRSKDQWMRDGGGFRLAETPEQLQARLAKIKELEVSLKTGRP